MNSKKHPIWFTINLLIVAACLTLFSYINASKFDGTEIKMIIELVVAYAGIELFKNRNKKSE